MCLCLSVGGRFVCLSVRGAELVCVVWCVCVFVCVFLCLGVVGVSVGVESGRGSWVEKKRTSGHRSGRVYHVQVYQSD